MEPAWGHEALRTWFQAQPADTVLETELLRAFFPDALETGVGLALFQKHFLLYRRLWQFDDELRSTSGQRLWIRGIRVSLLAAPPADRCGYLALETGAYCLEAATKNLCPRHDGLAPELSGMKSYYLDATNLEGMTEAGLEQLMDQFWGWWGNPNAAAALRTLGLPADADARAVKTRWRKLSLEHHPDRGGDPAQFQRLSEAWAALKPRTG